MKGQIIARSGDHQLCPYCRIRLPIEATVCNGCGAEKGYWRYNGIVFGRWIIWVLLFVALAVAFLAGTDTSRSAETQSGMKGIMFFALMFAGICAFRLWSKPLWYR